MTTTRRPWPAPALGEPDYIIRTQMQLDQIVKRAFNGPLPLHAAALLNDHCVAVAAMADLYAVLYGPRPTEDGQ